MNQTAANHEEQEEQVVKILFKKTKFGFGPYEIVDQECILRKRKNIAVAVSRSYSGSGGNKTSVFDNPTRWSLIDDQDVYVTDVGSFPRQLQDLISKEEYEEKMAMLMSVMPFSSFPTMPLATFATCTVIGIYLDIFALDRFGFFLIVLPIFGVFVSFHLLERSYKDYVEGIFQDWRPNIRARFKVNVMNGNLAELEFRAISQVTNNALSASCVKV